MKRFLTLALLILFVGCTSAPDYSYPQAKPLGVPYNGNGFSVKVYQTKDTLQKVSEHYAAIPGLSEFTWAPGTGVRATGFISNDQMIAEAEGRYIRKSWQGEKIVISVMAKSKTEGDSQIIILTGEEPSK